MFLLLARIGVNFASRKSVPARAQSLTDPLGQLFLGLAPRSSTMVMYQHPATSTTLLRTTLYYIAPVGGKRLKTKPKTVKHKVLAQVPCDCKEGNRTNIHLQTFQNLSAPAEIPFERMCFLMCLACARSN